jgi:MFS family permease
MKRSLTRIRSWVMESLLAERDFRCLWLSSTISSFGGQITMLALPLTAVVMLDATPTQMGVMAALEALPFALFSLQAGVFIDRLRKLPILIAGDVFIGCVLAAIPLMHFLHLLTMHVLYAVGFALGIAFVIVGTAAQVYLTHLAGRKRLIEANSLFTASDSLARLTGPGLAGILIQLLSAPLAILADCFGFVLSFVLLLRIRSVEAAPVAQRQFAFWSEIKAGLALVRSHAILRVLSVCAGGWFFLFQGFLTLETLFASRQLGLSAGQIGAAHMLGGGGAMLAAVLASRLTKRLGMGAPVLLGITLSGASWIMIASIGRSPHAFWLLGLGLFLFDLGVTTYWINFSSLRQSVTPDAMLGRMTATMRFFTVAPAPFGAYLAGWLGEHIGLASTIALLGGCTMLLGLGALLLTDLRRVPDMSTRHVMTSPSATVAESG